MARTVDYKWLWWIRLSCSGKTTDSLSLRSRHSCCRTCTQLLLTPYCSRTIRNLPYSYRYKEAILLKLVIDRCEWLIPSKERNEASRSWVSSVWLICVVWKRLVNDIWIVRRGSISKYFSSLKRKHTADSCIWVCPHISIVGRDPHSNEICVFLGHCRI